MAVEDPPSLVYALASPVAFLFAALVHWVYTSYFGSATTVTETRVEVYPPLPSVRELATYVGSAVVGAGHSFATSYGYRKEYELAFGVAILAHIAYRWYGTRFNKPCG
jgi:hypothetical protein